jgi:aconitate hydratase
MKYLQAGTPLIIIAGQEYGTGSSRDWAAKGPLLLGVRAVIAEGFERIHRSNLIGMGILPLQFVGGASAGSLGLTGREIYEITGIDGVLSQPGSLLTVRADDQEFVVKGRVDTPQEAEYYRHGGILQFVLRQLM